MTSLTDRLSPSLPDRWHELGRIDRAVPAATDTLYVGLASDLLNENVATGWAFERDGLVVVGTHVRSRNANTAAHEHEPSASDRLSPVGDVGTLGRNSRVARVAGDPRWFARDLAKFARDGGPIVQGFPEMASDGLDVLLDEIANRSLVHDDDPVLTSHIRAAVITRDVFGRAHLRRTDRSTSVVAVDAIAIALFLLMSCEPR